jgi:uncharacterized protein HemX
MSTEPNKIVVEKSASALTMVLALVVAALVGVGIYSYVHENNRKEDAVAAAAHQVGDAAEDVGDAVKDAARK